MSNKLIQFLERNKIYISIAAVSIGLFGYIIYVYTLHQPLNSDSSDDNISKHYNIISPPIALLACIITFLAFYIQYLANQDIKNQFKVQQFDSLFYEMLKLHKENVNEIELEKSSSGVVKGRAAFYQMKIEFEIILDCYRKYNNNLDEDIFKKAYGSFFWGIYNEANSLDDNLLNELSSFYKIHENDKKEYALQIKYGQGHHQFLGHYYRHLYYIAKLVTSNGELSEPQKYHYLKILRAQLSNYEQTMLFYNWLSGYGKSWEEIEETIDTKESVNKKYNHFFTKYKMIHNMWHTNLYKDTYITHKIDTLKDYYSSISNNNTELFEIDE
ncbi:putative phage abortive infection protein [Riemerella anatipestifer]|uniref:putative phage abortive infection protein n=1 Tax=Riemerella anatipestifer TaxID=34085 RepID=UPI002363468B|nr:putative phage abortive infection protein [Riemerella anatipestifer]MDD1538309.1 hypothetical protein [Riemerella anatipestifer]